LAQTAKDLDGDLLHAQVGAEHVKRDGLNHVLLTQPLPHVLESHAPQGLVAVEQGLAQLLGNRARPVPSIVEVMSK
jgi:hypothetical protein